jgi:hypothetical protein
MLTLSRLTFVFTVRSVIVVASWAI